MFLSRRDYKLILLFVKGIKLARACPGFWQEGALNFDEDVTGITQEGGGM